MSNDAKLAIDRLTITTKTNGIMSAGERNRLKYATYTKNALDATVEGGISDGEQQGIVKPKVKKSDNKKGTK